LLRGSNAENVTHPELVYREEEDFVAAVAAGDLVEVAGVVATRVFKAQALGVGFKE